MFDGHRRHVQRARIDVPGIVVLRCVFEELQLISAPARCKSFEIRLLVEQAGDTAGLLVDHHAKNRIFQRDRTAGVLRLRAALFLLSSTFCAANPNHLVTQCRHFQDMKRHIGEVRFPIWRHRHNLRS